MGRLRRRTRRSQRIAQTGRQGGREGWRMTRSEIYRREKGGRKKRGEGQNDGGNMYIPPPASPPAAHDCSIQNKPTPPHPSSQFTPGPSNPLLTARTQVQGAGPTSSLLHAMYRVCRKRSCRVSVKWTGWPGCSGAAVVVGNSCVMTGGHAFRGVG